ncbi:mitochondrial inner-membrane-bound regulator-domain-containing protein [Blakeslea trispora]|nr:mitochondrial inner-membrane-bound regulator-domain-containing protein [Blakeslea trispora]
MSNYLRNQLISAAKKHTLSINKRSISYSQPRLLSDEKLQEILSEIEKPLQKRSIVEESKDILLESVETFKPLNKKILTTKKMDSLRNNMSNAFTVRQLRDYLEAKQAPVKKSSTKDKLLTQVINQQWGISTQEQLNKERLSRQKLLVKDALSSSKEELFFIIGDNGNTIRSIEKKNNVNIIIDIENDKCIIEGLPEEVKETKKDIQAYLTIQHEYVELPKESAHDEQLQSQIEQALPAISKVAGTFISMKENKLDLASLSNKSMDHAKRLLSLFLTKTGAAGKKALDTSNKTAVTNYDKLTRLPFHDLSSMSLFDKKFYWNRIQTNQHEKSQSEYQLMDGESIGSFDQISKTLLKPFDQLDNITMDARFGYLLFQQPRTMNDSGCNSIDRSTLSNLCNSRTLFHNIIPPRLLTSSLIPLIQDNKYHQRLVQVDYVDQSLLVNYPHVDSADLQRLRLEFVLNDHGNITLKSMTGEKKRSVMDILGVHGNVDIRLYAKESVSLQPEFEALADKCQLLSYSELNAPATFEGLVLTDVTFINKKQYILDNALVSIDHIEQQDQQTRRTELKVKSVDPTTLEETQSPHRWSSFSAVLDQLAQKWKYSV